MTLRQPFPESLVETRGVGAGPDFPGSSGDRERGKFRPSTTPGLTKVAVTGDDGQPLTRSTEQIMEEVLLYNKAILQALALLADGASFTADEVLNEVS